MALKFISIADLLLIRGDGGVSGDNGCRANTHAGVVVPLTSKRAFPLDDGGGEHRPFKITGGEAQSQHPCGFQATDPTAPTDPANLDGAACPSSFDDIGQARNTDVLVDAWHVLDLALGRCEFKTAMNSDEFHSELDDGPDVLSAHERDELNVEPPVVPDPLAWRALAAAYYAHHFSCPVCIANGRGLIYGKRCTSGVLLWNAYQEHFIADGECINPPFSTNSSPLQERNDK